MADVVFDQVVGDVQGGRQGESAQPQAPASAAPPFDEAARAKMRTEMRLMARREARVRAS